MHTFRRTVALCAVSALAYLMLVGPSRPAVDALPIPMARVSPQQALPGGIPAMPGIPLRPAATSAVESLAITSRLEGVLPAGVQRISAPPSSIPSTASGRVEVVCPVSYAEGMTIRVDGVGVRQNLRGGYSVPACPTQDGVVYAHVRPDVAARRVAMSDRGEEFLTISPEASYDTFTYDFKTEGSGDFRVSDRLEVVDGEGVARLRLDDVVYWVDADRENAHAARVALTLVDDHTAELAISIPEEHRGRTIHLDPAWSSTASMATIRQDHAAVLLPDGRVLVAGGRTGTTTATALRTCEVYNPATRTWTSTGMMATARYAHTLTMLANGKVLAAGGWGVGAADLLTSTELYDIATGTWSTTLPLNAGRYLHTATLLKDGRVVAIGGWTGAAAVSVTEVFDPAVLRWTPVGPLSVSRYFHSATLLPSGKVLVAGGQREGPMFLASCEILDPATGTWSAGGNLPLSARFNHSATLLATGKVLAAGGRSGAATIATAALYDPATNLWTSTGSMPGTRSLHAAVLLPNGTVVAAGGNDGVVGTNSLATSTIFDPVAGTWTAGPNLVQARRVMPAIVLSTGRVLFIGGFSSSTLPATATCEFYDPTDTSWTLTGSLAQRRFGHSVHLLPNGKVLCVAGSYSDPVLNQQFVLLGCELYDPATGQWTATGQVNVARYLHTGMLLPDGKVLIAGGQTSQNGQRVSTNTAELYDPATGRWTLTGAMSTLRGQGHSVVLLGNGKILVTGGWNTDAFSTCELYDPAAGTWSATGSMAETRQGHAMLKLHSGDVMVVGGHRRGVYTANCEIYSAAAGTWSSTTAMSQARANHCAALLPDGRILIAGGVNSGAGVEVTAEIYNPTTRTWTSTPNMAVGRYESAMSLLPSGRVITAGSIMGGVSASTEVFDPAVGTWSSVANLPQPLYGPITIVTTSGKIFCVAGTTGNGGDPRTEFYDDTRASDAWRPVISTINGNAAGPFVVAPGSALTVVGTKLRGVSEAGGGVNGNSGNDAPLVRLAAFPDGGTYGESRSGIGRLWTLPARSWEAGTGLTVTLPPAAEMTNGYYLLFVVVNGIISEGKILSVGGAAPPNTAPDDVVQMGQFKMDGTTVIPVGTRTTESSVILKGGIRDLDPGQTVKMQVEVRPIGTPFNGTFTHESATVPSGGAVTTVQVTVSGLVNGTSYHWRSRAIDNLGATSVNWQSFGGNPDGVEDFGYFAVVNNNPPVPGSLGQFRSDRVTQIPVGVRTNETTVVFKGDVSDSDAGQNVKLQVELRPIGTAFTGTFTHESSAVPGNPGSTVEITATALTNTSDYHWRARTVDDQGGASAWSSFGGNADGVTDFRVDTAAGQPPVVTAGSVGQFKSDGVTVIAVAGTTNEPQIVVKGTATDAEGDQWKLEVEIRPVGSPFSAVPTASTPLVASGSVASMTVQGLTNGIYHWKYRGTDAFGNSSAWSSFGGNADGMGDFTVDTSGNVAPAIGSLGQFRTDGTTVIAEGATTNETSVVLKGLITDANAGQLIRMRVEVKPIATAFDGTANGTSGWDISGSTVSVTVSGLSSSTDYHWRAWAEDTNASSSAPLSYGTAPDGNRDFRVSLNLPPSAFPTMPAQTQQDGVTVIPTGGTATSTLVVFRATATDPESDPIRLEVEVKPIGTAFTGTPTVTSGTFASGTNMFVSVPGLLNLTAYHWQIRAVDSSGGSNGWLSYGFNTEADVDFFVQIASFFSSGGPTGSRGRKLCAADASQALFWPAAGILIALAGWAVLRRIR